MKKLITTIILVVALLATTNVSYGDGGPGNDTIIKNNDLSVEIEEISVEINDCRLGDTYEGATYEGSTYEGATNTLTDNSTTTNSLTNNSTTTNNNTNEGNKSEINITDNSTYTEQLTPTDLLNPNGYTPLADRLLDKDMYISKSIFKLQRYGYTCKELTQFANPGRFLAILWPEWDNKYDIEIATFAKYRAKKNISVLPKAVVSIMDLTKIGEASASAKDLNKSEHQVMAALAVRSAEAGATVIVFKDFSRPLVKVDSFVIGGGGTQVGSPQSIFNGATGIGSSSSETVTRACVVAELYR